MGENKNNYLNHDEVADKIKIFLNKLANNDGKKAHQVKKWLCSYISYIDKEKEFKPQKLIRYPRGSIVFADLGFNIGSEYGGLHYCIVLNKDDEPKKPTLNVIPLTSNIKKANIKYNVNLENAFSEALIRVLKLRIKRMKNSTKNLSEKAKESKKKFNEKTRGT